MVRFVKATDYIEIIHVNIEWQKERLAKETNVVFIKQIEKNILNLEYKLATIKLCYVDEINLN